MARKVKSAKTPKEPGRIRQMGQVFKATIKADRSSLWWILLGFFAPIILAIGLALWLSSGSVFGLVLWIISGVLAGLLVSMIILGRKAERVAYRQISGRAGAVGAIFKSALPRGWRGSETPIHVNPKTQDAVYRAVGRGGIVLVAEGPKSRTNRSLSDEKRKIARVLPNVPIYTINVGPDDDSVELHLLAKRIKGYKKTLTKPEFLAIINRLSSLRGSDLPIPKGVDPNRVRSQRPR